MPLEWLVFFFLPIFRQSLGITREEEMKGDGEDKEQKGRNGKLNGKAIYLFGKRPDGGHLSGHLGGRLSWYCLMWRVRRSQTNSATFVI
jgi:hypothetical protein